MIYKAFFVVFGLAGPAENHKGVFSSPVFVGIARAVIEELALFRVSRYSGKADGEASASEGIQFKRP